MADVHLTIDGTDVTVPAGANLVAAARAAGVWVPTLCHLADLPPAPAEHACGLCLVRVEGAGEPVRACETPARDGLVVSTADPDLVPLRRAALGRILGNHPHACLRCAQREACAREPCSTNVPADERCCPMLSDCELVRLADAVGLPENLARYVPAGLPAEQDPLFARDPNLCIACGRCVRACEHLRGVAAIELVEEEGRLVVRPRGGSVAASGCRHCGTCVEVCPTGARRDAGFATAAGPDEILACRNACPAGVDVPLCVALMAEGRAAEAQAVVRNRVPLPAVVGHVCYRPCEDDCRRARLSDPVAICELERVAAGADATPPAPGAETGAAVAVVGSGPAGLAAAYYLRLLGHGATVFEAEREAGGMLRYGIPPERLPREALAGDLRALADLGVGFTTGVRLGAGVSLGDLAAGFDAVVIAAGAGPGKRLPLDGAGLAGVTTALDFLRSAAEGEPTPAVEGRRVAVIGGGGGAMDAAATAARGRAEAVDVFCLESRGEMPAPAAEIDAALSLGVRLHPGWGPAALVPRAGRVAGVDLVRCLSVFDDEGRFAPTFEAATGGRAAADVVILAVGQERDPAVVAQARCAVPVPVVEAGDFATGPANVAKAIASGREAAHAVHRMLGFGGGIPEFVPDPLPPGRMAPSPGFAALPRAAKPLTAGTAAEEAARCLRCDLRFAVELPPRPPGGWRPLVPEEVARVPAEPGVVTFLDAEGRVLAIQGTPVLRAALATPPKGAEWFAFELSGTYTRRESELLSRSLSSDAVDLGDDDRF